ncbi:ABC transporter substrate-binding protein [Actinoallomurus rhizosphaericola]|uniref:ABC transporter substrate-binding protein n=1 Tax=Actinoallomurus rhizosphaericola TaxID=2952536 RepID=UPI002092A38A|nr:ABC transporter substrate-binding protein [Actinoallomurus rhizosphaericola]MCO5997995.1 ABC transporter substrate-binding protein [Actinoallomurus rhizosphaericola]
MNGGLAVVRDTAELLVAGPDPSVLRLGLLLPLSGPLGLTGPSGLSAACLAAGEVTEAGRPVELVLVDAGRRPQEVARDARLLADAGLVQAFVGYHTSDVHRAVEAAIARRSAYFFTPPQEGGARRQGVVLLGGSPADQLAPALRWLTEHRRPRRWALVGSDYIWPRSVHRVAARLIRSIGAEVVLDRLLPFEPVVGTGAEEAVDALLRVRADAVLVSLVGRDLVRFNRVFASSGRASRVIRLSGSLEMNGLLAIGGDDTGELYSAMRSFAGQDGERRIALAERYQAELGGHAPVLDVYAEGLYDGVHLAAALAAYGALDPRRVKAAAGLLLNAPGEPDARRAWAAAPLGPPRAGGYLARADGLDLTVVSRY